MEYFLVSFASSYVWAKFAALIVAFIVPTALLCVGAYYLLKFGGIWELRHRHSLSVFLVVLGVVALSFVPLLWLSALDIWGVISGEMAEYWKGFFVGVIVVSGRGWARALGRRWLTKLLDRMAKCSRTLASPQEITTAGK